MITRSTPLWMALMVFAFLACNTSKKNDAKATETQKDSMTTATDTQEKNSDHYPPGDFFMASGNEPFWNITLNAEQLVFTSLIEGFEEVHTPLPMVVRAADANVKRYRAETEKVIIDLQIAQGDCADTMADKQFPYSVAVTIQHTGDAEVKNLNGCGVYQTDKRLNDIWVLEKLGEETADASWFAEKLPEMEINVAENTLMGYAGCNRMRGSIFWEPGLLRFTNIATTRMACKPENKEAAFLKNLESATTYRIENNRLWLSNPNGPQLVFKKID